MMYQNKIYSAWIEMPQKTGKLKPGKDIDSNAEVRAHSWQFLKNTNAGRGQRPALPCAIPNRVRIKNLRYYTLKNWHPAPAKNIYNQQPLRME
jgi:hypothetical protein